jgi:hypothetical protein
VYEGGRGDVKRHALRTDGAPDQYGWRPTLCGTRAYPMVTAFEPWRGRPSGHEVCQTCWTIAERFPAAGPLDVSNDLARARIMFGRLRALVAASAPAAALRHAVGQALACVEGAWDSPSPLVHPP